MRCPNVLAAFAALLLLLGGAARGQQPEATPAPAQEPQPAATPAPIRPPAPPPAMPAPAAPVPEKPPAPETAPDEAAPAPAEATPPAAPEGQTEAAASAGVERPREEGFLPRLDVYFPEGDLDLRVNRLINKVFFEGQVKYNFIRGDISAFLRYRYYGYRRTTQFTVFDSISFQELKDFSNDFDRVRGTLLLMQWPHSYHQRTFAMVELDRISTNKEEVAKILRLGETNTFVRFGYQLGTPEDARSNAIVGETRARSERLFTAFRDIGPGGAGFTGAVTYGFGLGVGDFDYVKAEAETLKRFDISERTFFVGRLHAGSFLRKGQRNRAEVPEPATEFDLLSIPLGEYFRLDGRENLKGLSEKMRGTDEIHMTWEYFFPWFLGANHRFLRLEWQNWYWILYAGAGTVGLDHNVYADFGSYIPDAGVGFESSFRLRKYRFFLSGIVAQALKGSGGVEARVSLKSYH
jgi:hypothetical protein